MCSLCSPTSHPVITHIYYMGTHTHTHTHTHTSSVLINMYLLHAEPQPSSEDGWAAASPAPPSTLPELGQRWTLPKEACCEPLRHVIKQKVNNDHRPLFISHFLRSVSPQFVLGLPRPLKLGLALASTRTSFPLVRFPLPLAQPWRKADRALFTEFT